MNGMGSYLNGARWTPKEAFTSVYACLDREAVEAEFFRSYEYECILNDDVPLQVKQARVLVGLEVRLHRVLDLNDARIQGELRVGTEQMTRVPWRYYQARGEEALTQAIGREARGLGVEAILVPCSPAVHSLNLVIFQAEVGLGSRMSVTSRGPLFP
jgi:RES domain-containing protein